MLDRRSFLAAVSSLALPAAVAKQLDRQVGVTTSSFSGFVGSKPGQFELLDLPRVMRDELDMRVVDLNTTTLGSLEPAALDRFREAASKAGCVLTNLKMNQRDIDMDSPETETRRRALAEYKRAIDAAARLGCRWARPLPRAKRPDMAVHIASYRELADHARPPSLSPPPAISKPGISSPMGIIPSTTWSAVSVSAGRPDSKARGAWKSSTPTEAGSFAI